MKTYKRSELRGMPCITLTNGRKYYDIYRATDSIRRSRGDELTKQAKRLLDNIREMCLQMDSLPLVYVGCYNHVTIWYPGFLEEE